MHAMALTESPTTTPPETATVIVHYGGREYRCRLGSARIFLRQAMRVAANHDTELVVLVHDRGVDLLLITDAMPFAVGGLDPSPGAVADQLRQPSVKSHLPSAIAIEPLRLPARPEDHSLPDPIVALTLFAPTFGP